MIIERCLPFPCHTGFLWSCDCCHVDFTITLYSQRSLRPHINIAPKFIIKYDTKNYITCTYYNNYGLYLVCF